MPGIPLISREANYSRDSDQMCRQEPRLSPEEETAAEESFSAYCKPLELYNILRHRAIKNPSFIQRSLHYKLQEKHKRRIHLSISISGAIGDGLQTHSLFPLYVVLARPVSSSNVERSSSYCFKRACKLTSFNGAHSVSSASAKFLLPEINNLSKEVKSGSLAMLLVSCADITNPKEIDLTKDSTFSLSSNIGGYCLLGKIPVEFLHLSWEKSPNLSFGERVEMMSTVSMQSCFMKLSGAEGEKCLSFQFPHNSEAVSILQQVPVIISAEELGSKDLSSYDLYTYNNIPTNSLPHVARLRAGNVKFNYKYYNNMLEHSETTEDYACPFCLMKSPSYKALKFHLKFSHDLFGFHFRVNENQQVVTVFMADTCSSEFFGNIADPKEEPFFFCYKPLRRRIPKSPTEIANHVSPRVLDSDMHATPGDFRDMAAAVLEGKIDTPPASVSLSSATATFPEQESVPSVLGSDTTFTPPLVVLEFAKTRKLSVEQTDPRSLLLLKKRQFFHSRRAQLMALEQVLGDEDSEDEIDDDVADLEDRRMLDDFVDVSQHEKQMMHMWNSFVRKQRVLANAHVPWACEAFSKQHAKLLVQTPRLEWCWRLFMMKLWNHGLLDPNTMNQCNLIIERAADT